MRKWITLLMTLLVGSSISYANANMGEVTFEAGYRHDNVNWRNQFPSSDPVVSTSTKFKDVDIFQIGLNGRSTVGCNFYVRGSAYWGWVLDGDYEQSASTYGSLGGCDNGFGNTFDASIKRKCIIDDRYVYGVGAAIGYPFFFCDCSMVLAPVVGYSLDSQTFRVDDRGIGVEEESGFDFPVNGRDCCCNRKFLNRWYGPFIGVDFEYRPFGQCWNFYGELEYHWAYFTGKQGCRDEFTEYHGDRNRHSNNGSGWVFGIGADYDISNCWTAGFSLKFQDYSASKHHRHHGYNDDSEQSGSRGKHSEKWHSYAINLTVGRAF